MIENPKMNEVMPIEMDEIKSKDFLPSRSTKKIGGNVMITFTVVINNEM